MSGRRIVVAITGASGAAIGTRVVELLAKQDVFETHLVVTAAGERTLAHEVGPDALATLETKVACRHAADDIGAAIASGSYRTEAMIVAPCSIRTLSAIATSNATDLVSRAADVHLKERRRLVLLVREAPLHLGHIRAMAAATEFGAIVLPPVPSFYNRPETVADLVDDIARRALATALPDLAALVPQWTGDNAP